MPAQPATLSISGSGRLLVYALSETSGTTTSTIEIAPGAGQFRLRELRWKQTAGAASHGHPAVGVDSSTFTDDGYQQVAKVSGTTTETSVTSEAQWVSFTTTTGSIYLRSNWQSGTNNEASWVVCLERL